MLVNNPPDLATVTAGQATIIADIAAHDAAILAAITAAGTMKRSVNAGIYTIPAGPTVGTSVTSGIANTYGAYVEFEAAASADKLILGVVFKPDAGATYMQAEVATGAIGSETPRGVAKIGSSAAGASLDTVALFLRPVKVTAGTRIAVRLADNAAATAHPLTLLVIDEANEEDY